MSQQNRRPVQGGFYKHFKGRLYQIMAVATHSETREEMVVYQALYGTFKVYVRPMSQFMSEVDHEKYPEVKQQYRFERIEFVAAKEVEKMDLVNELEVIQMESIIEKTMLSNKLASDVPILDIEQQEEPTANAKAELIQFLDADTCKEKLNILLGIRNHLTDNMLNSMMISMDIPIPEGTMEEHLDILKDYLQTRVRFEINRLR